MSKIKGGRARCFTPVNEEQLREAVSKKAQELYKKSGNKPGHDLDNWLEAEKIVRKQLCENIQHIPC